LFSLSANSLCQIRDALLTITSEQYLFQRTENMKTAKMAILFLSASISMVATAHVMPLENFESKPILADLKDLKALNIPVLAKDEFTEVGYAMVTPLMQQALQEHAHKVSKCGGFEDLSTESQHSFLNFEGMLHDLATIKQANDLYEVAPYRMMTVEKDANIAAALDEVQESNLRSTVEWLSSFKSRFNKLPDPNVHVLQLKTRLETMLAASNLPSEISVIDHQSTKQKSLRVRLIGRERPDEVIVLGGHLDSISGYFGGGSAPGADDNASGSANLIETLRIISQKAQPQRTIEFFWYAGEESGLLGSAEIAKQYKADNKNVIAVLQLDMTLFPGAGEFVLGSMNDFTSSWLRDYLKAINPVYLNVRIVDDNCGYGCSDHASWYRQGYPTLMPFEATMRTMNKNIHTPDDQLTPAMNFKHSAVYAKIAVIFAMDLANSTVKQPY
jgi:leucyl aminopeptidase